jgi:hypothetical protein
MCNVDEMLIELECDTRYETDKFAIAVPDHAVRALPGSSSKAMSMFPLLHFSLHDKLIVKVATGKSPVDIQQEARMIRRRVHNRRMNLAHDHRSKPNWKSMCADVMSVIDAHLEDADKALLPIVF